MQVMNTKTPKGIFLAVLVVFGVAASATAATYSIERRLNDIRDPRAVAETHRSDEVIVQFKGEEKFRRVKIEAGEDVASAIARFRQDSNVEYAEPNYIAYAFMTPNDTYYSYQWNFSNPTYGGINVEQAWDTTNGSGVTVAVIDTGIAYEDYGIFRRAPDLAGTQFVPGYDFANNDTHPNDDEGHGTHVAGTIAQSTNNGIGVAGVAFGARLMPIKALNAQGSGTYADIAESIRWAADNGAKVINMSHGGPAPATDLEDALAYAYNKGVTIVAASGNDNAGSVSYPAAYNQYVIAVGATRFDETRAPYSNYGSALDIVAPGGDLGVDQNHDGYGDGVLQQTFGNNVGSFSYYFYSGTSMATPHVAGVAALIISAGKASTPADVQTLLQNTADDLGPTGRDDQYGWGIVDAAEAVAGDPIPPPPPPPPAQCADGIDNDGDSLIDLADPGCTSSTDNDETDPVPPPPGPTTLFTDDFQSGFAKWTESNEFDWNPESPAERAVPGSVSGNRVAHADACRLTAGCFLTTTNTIDMSAYSSASLSFKRYVDNALDSGEFLRVDIFDGSTWRQVAYWTNGAGDDDTWRTETIDLTPYRSANFKVRFVSKENSTTEEVEVDDVVVTAN